MKRIHIQTGQRYNNLIAVGPASSTISGAQRWLFLCDCGRQTIAQVHRVVKGSTKTCGCLRAESRRLSRKYTTVESSARKIWRQNYKDGAISFEDFFSLSQKDCAYCGSPPNNNFTLVVRGVMQGTFIYNGLDRIDSSFPHELSNVVPCCSICNRMKSDMSLENFLSHIRRINKHLDLKSTPTLPTSTFTA